MPVQTLQRDSNPHIKSRDIQIYNAASARIRAIEDYFDSSEPSDQRIDALKTEVKELKEMQVAEATGFLASTSAFPTLAELTCHSIFDQYTTSLIRDFNNAPDFNKRIERWLNNHHETQSKATWLDTQIPQTERDARSANLEEQHLEEIAPGIRLAIDFPHFNAFITSRLNNLSPSQQWVLFEKVFSFFYEQAPIDTNLEKAITTAIGKGLDKLPQLFLSLLFKNLMPIILSNFGKQLSLDTLNHTTRENLLLAAKHALTLCETDLKESLFHTPATVLCGLLHLIESTSADTAALGNMRENIIAALAYQIQCCEKVKEKLSQAGFSKSRGPSRIQKDVFKAYFAYLYFCLLQQACDLVPEHLQPSSFDPSKNNTSIIKLSFAVRSIIESEQLIRNYLTILANNDSSEWETVFGDKAKQFKHDLYATFGVAHP